MTDETQDSTPGGPGRIAATSSMDLGWREVCEAAPATRRARSVEARICAACAEGEPDPEGAR